MSIKRRDGVDYTTALMIMISLIGGCSYSGSVLKSEEVKSIPDKTYEQIIRLDTPEGMPLEPDAGFVYVEREGKLTTDFPREIIVQSLDGLDKYEQYNRNNMGKYAVKDGKGGVRGYYEILPQYRVHLWERGDHILLQIITPESRGIGKTGDGAVGIGGPVPGGI